LLILSEGSQGLCLGRIKAELPQTGNSDIISVARYSTVENLERLFDVESYYTNVINHKLTYPILMSEEKKHIDELNRAVSEIRKRIQHTMELISEYLSDISKRESYSDGKIKQMLLDEAFSQVTGINS